MPRFQVVVVNISQDIKMEYRGNFTDIKACLEHYEGTWRRHGARVILVKELRVVLKRAKKK